MLRLPFVLVLLLGLWGCGEDEVVTSGGPAGSNKRKPATKPTATQAEERVIPPPVDFQETAFVESERSRDPFRSYARVFVEETRGSVKSQREVMLDQYAIEDLRLVAIVQRVNPPKAMFIDPNGLGHFVQRGQYLGRPAVVQPGGAAGAAYEVNWRVDRIRDGDVVLVRDDPSNPDIPSATRVVPLRNDDFILSEKDEEAASRGLEAEIREMKERLEKMAAAESARKRSEEGGEAANP